MRRCYLDAFSAWFLALTAVMCALADWVFALYVPMSTGRFIVLLALDELIILLAMGTGTLRFTRAAEPIRSWLRRDPGPAGAIGAWSAATRLPRRALEIAVPHAVVLGGIPATILIEAEFGFSPVTALLFFVGLLAAAIYPAIIFYFTLELMLRPVLRDIAPWLPAGFEPPASGVSLRRKLLVALPLVNIISGGFVGVLASLASGGSLSDLGLYVVFSVVIASTASLVLTLLVVRALLVPVDDLLSATRRISEGDLTTRALVGSDDEMGTLAGSFNTMTSELVESRQRLVQAREEERRRLRRDLHDGVGPTLAAVILQLDGARRLLATDTEAADALLGQLRS
ncbi:MAG: HAMP domain-containing protein, partial [Thermoleophilaceae bacterium]